ncbi:MAG: hypothetical protein KDD91_15635 [Caldilinea sp.]|nr:hypothetical protein [Caldilinea sp.]MCB0039941.1 hypothetical protein [Caldilinea sp.]MCB0146580.1 hypothetical protein [Caldilineaceae bacterium]HRW46321.1 hypothetical protein [Caldilinea sp.]
MGLFSRIAALFTGKAPGGSNRYLPIYIVDHRCREPIAGQVDLLNELSLADDEGGGYYVRKVLHTSGERRCFGQVEVQLWLDGKKQITNHEVQGGRWLTAEEYDAEVERQAEEARREAEAAEESQPQPTNDDATSAGVQDDPADEHPQQSKE